MKLILLFLQLLLVVSVFCEYIKFKNNSIEIDKSLGEGQFSVVYKTKENPPAALKVNKRTDEEDEQFREHRGFPPSQELHVLQKLGKLIDFDNSNGLTILKMKYETGKQISELVSSGEIKYIEELMLLINAAKRAIRVLHSKGIAHNDIHSGNILFEQRNGTFSSIFKGKYKATLIDFGLAKDLSKETGSDSKALKRTDYNQLMYETMMVYNIYGPQLKSLQKNNFEFEPDW